MKKYLVMLVTAIAFCAITTVYAQEYDWDNPDDFSFLKVFITGKIIDTTSKKSKQYNIKLNPGKKPIRFGSEDIIPAQNPDEVEEVWLPMTNTGVPEALVFNLQGSSYLKKDTWQKFTFAFTPQTGGKVKISLGNRYGGIRFFSEHSQKYMSNWTSLVYGKMESKNVNLKGAAFASENDLKAWDVTIDKKNKELANIQPVFSKETRL